MLKCMDSAGASRHLTGLQLGMASRYELRCTALMAVPVVVLALGSIFLGYLGKGMMIGVGTNFRGNSLFVLPHNLVLFESDLRLFTSWQGGASPAIHAVGRNNRDLHLEDDIVDEKVC